MTVGKSHAVAGSLVMVLGVSRGQSASDKKADGSKYQSSLFSRILCIWCFIALYISVSKKYEPSQPLTSLSFSVSEEELVAG